MYFIRSLFAFDCFLFSNFGFFVTFQVSFEDFQHLFLGDFVELGKETATQQIAIGKKKDTAALNALQTQIGKFCLIHCLYTQLKFSTCTVEFCLIFFR